MKVLEVAKLHNVSALTVYNWIRKGLKFRVVKQIGKKPYKIITDDNLNEFLGVKKDD